MNGLWLVSYLVLWVLVVLVGFVFLALAREIEALHKKQETLENYIRASGDKSCE